MELAPSPNMKILIALADEAGRVIMDIYNSKIETKVKPDNSPVTQADEAAETVILNGLRARFPDIPVVSEEAVSKGGAIVTGKRFFLVDPLDGTKEFISRNGEFTVNIALVTDGVASAGVVYAPAIDEMFWGEVGVGAAKGANKIMARKANPHALTAVASRSHNSPETEAYLERLKVQQTINSGSSLKFCRVAEGAADIYPRFGNTREWDTAAGQAVLVAAGGRVVVENGEPLRYGKTADQLLNPAFIAWGA